MTRPPNPSPPVVKKPKRKVHKTGPEASPNRRQDDGAKVTIVKPSIVSGLDIQVGPTRPTGSFFKTPKGGSKK